MFCKSSKKYLFFLLFHSFLNSQENPIFAPQQHNYLGTGIGVYSNDFGPLIHYEHGFDREWSTGFKTGVLFSYKDQKKWFQIGIQGNYHLNRWVKIPKTMDWYFGLDLGAAIGLTQPEASPIIGARLGYRYFFHHLIGLQIDAQGGWFLNGISVGFVYRIGPKE